MKNSLLTILSLIIIASNIFSQQNNSKNLSGPYLGQQLQGSTPEIFAEGILAKRYDSFHSTIAFTSAGDECYWQSDLSSNEFTISWARIENGKWTEPEIAPFAKIEYRDDCPFISPDGKKLFFISRRPLSKGEKAGKENIWFMDRMESGWSEPQPLPSNINDMSRIHWQVSVDNEGNLYFSIHQNESRGRRGDIYCSKLVNGNYIDPEKLDEVINSPDYEFSPFISPDGSYLLFSRETYGNGRCRIYISFKTKTGKWTEPINLYESYGIKGICPAVTKDNKYLFYLDYINSHSQPFWTDTKFIDELRPNK
ncbi:MAG: hypothetical protein V1720_15700 [bacterium]